MSYAASDEEIKARIAAYNAENPDKVIKLESHRSSSNRSEDKPSPDISDGALILSGVNTFLSRFVIYPSEHARIAHTLWIAHAHLMDLWDSTPRLAFLSPEPGSGKTRALEVSELLVPLPVEAVNVSPAYLFRKVGSEEGRATILFDEIDTVFGPRAKENEEIRGAVSALQALQPLQAVKTPMSSTINL